MSGRTHKQAEKLKLMKSIYHDVIDGYLGNENEWKAFAMIRDALMILHDPAVINADNPDNEHVLVEKFYQTCGSNKEVVVLVDQNLPEVELRQALIRFANIVTQDILNGPDPELLARVESGRRKALFEDIDVRAKVVKFPVIKRPPMSD